MSHTRILSPMFFLALQVGAPTGSISLAAALDDGSKEPAVEERIQRIERKLQELESRLQEALAKAAPASPPPNAATEDRIAELDQKIRILDRQKELERQGAAERAKETPIVGAGKDGFSVRSADGSYQLRVRGIMQLDGRFFADDTQYLTTNTFVARTARPVFEGTVAKYFDFKIMPDFGGGSTVLQEAYVDAKIRPQLNIRIGKQKTPFGLERLQSETDTIFIERAQPTNLVPNRDLGVQLYGDLWSGSLGYSLGVFNGVADGASLDIADHNSKDFAGRIVLRPFRQIQYEPLKGLGIGIAGTVGDRLGSLAVPSLPSYKTTGQQTFFRYRSDGTAAGTVEASGDLHRLSPQAFYYWKSFGLLGEYVLSSQDVRRGSNSARLQNSSWQLAASFVLTGENASYRGVTPKRPLEKGFSSWGALEIAGRYSQLLADGAAFPVYANPLSSARKAEAWAIGLNWYLNRILKAVLNYERTDFLGGAAAGNRQPENVIVSRLQIAY